MVLVKTTTSSVVKVRYDGIDAGRGSPDETSYAGNCSDPQYMYLVGLPDETLHRLQIRQMARVSQHLYVRCRKCPDCLKHRGRVWTARATTEVLAAKRTWFGTLTLAPDRATQARFAANRPTPDGILADQRPADHFARMVNHVTPELTKFLKRVRKSSGAAIRYLLVAEAHKSGMPHWHILLHEYAGTVTKAQLDAAWRFGFSQFRLVKDEDGRAAHYVCKYLSKSALVRIRASRQYGSALPDHLAERILCALHPIKASMRAIGGENPGLSGEGTPKDTGTGQPQS